jgi:hypothetical protein
LSGWASLAVQCSPQLSASRGDDPTRAGHEVVEPILELSLSGQHPASETASVRDHAKTGLAASRILPRTVPCYEWRFFTWHARQILSGAGLAGIHATSTPIFRKIRRGAPSSRLDLRAGNSPRPFISGCSLSLGQLHGCVDLPRCRNEVTRTHAAYFSTTRKVTEWPVVL